LLPLIIECYPLSKLRYASANTLPKTSFIEQCTAKVRELDACVDPAPSCMLPADVDVDQHLHEIHIKSLV
jgi:hypothetical protein